ncbi:MAG: class II fructose-bisphosphate aldolase [Patescibacteria group bacterium]|nr:class II fructose-bisphosphate aldolase [Patescibacteria group bacterium]
MLIKTDYLINRAKKEGYGIGCFITYNLESTLAIAEAAVEMRSPVIIGVSEFTIAFAGCETIAQLVRSIAENQGVSVPIALHLDHGRSLASAKACIEEGFTSVQIDGSHLPFDENINLTSQVVEYAHLRKIWVEGELGAIYGGHGESGEFKGKIPLANPGEVSEFIERTEVDLLAAALGTVHGKFDNEKIHFDLLREIKGITDLPLVLHGASGLPDSEISQAIKSGITKINFGTEIKNLFVDSIRQTIQANQHIDGARGLMAPTIEAIKNLVKEKINILGSANKI